MKNTFRSVHEKDYWRKKVVGGLAQKFKVRIKLPGKRGSKNRALTEDHENFLLDVFERSDLTYTNTGRKDNLYIDKMNGEKTFVQKHYLLWNLRDVFNIINTGEKSYSNELGKVLSVTCFYNFIRKHKQFVCQNNIPASLYLGEICENTCLM